MFVKGQSGNPAGRQKGTKNRNFMSCQYWFRMVNDNSLRLSPEKKIDIAFQALALLMPKVQALPLEPGDSVGNAQRAIDLIRELEAKPELGPVESERVPV